MVDGTDLKIAHLGWEKNEITIYSLESVSLPVRLGKYRPQNYNQNVAAYDSLQGDVFGLESGEPDQPVIIEENSENAPADASGTLVNVFTRYPLRKTSLAVNIPEGQATYYNFESNFDLKGKKLDKRLREEIAPISGGTMDSALLDSFPTEAGGLMVVMAEGNIPIIDELRDIKNFLPGGIPHYSLVSSNEIAIVNLVRSTLDPPSDQITAVVYIGCDFSRVIIMRGCEPISFVQSIREGYSSPQVCHTIFSKILLEQEEAGIPDINKIVLAGEIGMTRAFEFFSRQFPDAEVGPITSGPLNTNLLKSEEIAIFSNYAIPVSMAWEALDRKNQSFLRTDLMPVSVRDSQKAFKVAWHGFALLGVVFCGMVLLSYQGISRYNNIKSLQHSIQTKRANNEALQPDLALVNQFQTQIATAKTNLDFMDSVIVDPDKWSRLFSNLTENFKNVKKIWIDRVQSTPEGFTMIGRSLSRDRIPQLAGNLPGVFLQRVTRVISEAGEVVYEFELTAQIPEPIKENEPELPNNPALEESAPIDNSTSLPIADGASAEPSEQVNSAAMGPMLPSTQADVKPEELSAPVEPVKVTPPVEKAKPKTADEKPAAKLQTDNTQKPGAPPAASNNSAVSNASSASEDLYQNGIRLIKESKKREALAEFGLLVDKFHDAPEAPAANYWVGECYYALEKYSEAAAAFEASLTYKKNTKAEAALLMLGSSYDKLGQTDKARQQYEALLQRFPNGQYVSAAQNKLDHSAK